MTRTLFSSLAVAALLSAASVPSAVVLSGLASPAAACDCTNCSAQHCQPKGKVEYTWKIEEGTKNSSQQLGAPTVNRPRSRTPGSQNWGGQSEKWIQGN